jgi:hypothetical protein
MGLTKRPECAPLCLRKSQACLPRVSLLTSREVFNGGAERSDAIRTAKRIERSMAKVIWSCSHCGTVLALWQVKCTNCHRVALSWLHLAVALTICLSVVFVVLKLI